MVRSVRREHPTTGIMVASMSALGTISVLLASLLSIVPGATWPASVLFVAGLWMVYSG